MIDTIAWKIAAFLAARDGFEDDRTKIYQVGVDVVLSTLINIAGIFGLAFIIGNLPGAVIFLLCFMTVRSYSGGFHASTRTRCFFLTCGSYLVTALAVVPRMAQYYWYLAVGFSLADILVFAVYVPIENKNKRLPPDWKVQNRRKAWICMLLWKALALLLYRVVPALSLQIFMTEAVITILILFCRPWEVQG